MTSKSSFEGPLNNAVKAAVAYFLAKDLVPLPGLASLRKVRAEVNRDLIYRLEFGDAVTPREQAAKTLARTAVSAVPSRRIEALEVVAQALTMSSAPHFVRTVRHLERSGVAHFTSELQHELEDRLAALPELPAGVADSIRLLAEPSAYRSLDASSSKASGDTPTL